MLMGFGDARRGLMGMGVFRVENVSREFARCALCPWLLRSQVLTLLPSWGICVQKVHTGVFGR